ncbi:DUF2945 domain-containing protein [Brevundimonas sp.]|uniref:DUF2945 domain-containing protein n=1 Tax=Brevundimonas sp. TaxID=1871086 RepID=UPI003BAB2334
MNDDVQALVDRWIMAFCEAPVLIDPELMRRLLAEKEIADREQDAMTEKTFKAGDTVKWDHSQGTTTGKVVRKLTHPTKIKDHKVAASQDNPEYLVESGKTGARAAHKPSELRKA